MTCRTSVGAIRKVLPSSTTLEDDQINAAMEAARVMVDQVAAGCGSHLTDDILKEIEKYLAAHFSANTENTLSLSSEKSVCGGSASYGFKFGEGVKGTPFGITANMLSGGCLAEYDKQPVRFHSIGEH